MSPHCHRPAAPPPCRHEEIEAQAAYALEDLGPEFGASPGLVAWLQRFGEKHGAFDEPPTAADTVMHRLLSIMGEWAAAGLRSTPA